MARKDGKSFLANCIALYMQEFDGEPEAEVYVGASKEKQARYVHDIGKGILRNSPFLRARFDGWHQKFAKIYGVDKEGGVTGSFYDTVSSESSTQDAINPYLTLLDECHAHKTGDLRNVLTSGMGARAQPLELNISTAGIAWEGGWWKDSRDEAEAMLSGDIPEDDNLFALFYEPDEGLDWKTSDLYLQHAHPNLGVSVILSNLEKDRRAAIRDPKKENEFRTKQGNEWTQQTDRMIDMDEWKACPSEIDLEELRGRLCYGGVDLGKTQATSAYVLVFPPNVPDGAWSVLGWYWITQGLIDRRRRRDRPYIDWAKRGLIEVCPGPVRNDDLVRDRIAASADLYQVAEVGFDPFNAPDLMRRLQDEDGIKVVSIAQTFKYLSAPTKKLLDLVSLGRWNHGGDPVMRYHARNIGQQEDGKGNIQPSRKTSAGWYDSIQASIVALERGLAARVKGPSVYASRGPVVL
jgi:phage terminase large subunit-like protein